MLKEREDIISQQCASIRVEMNELESALGVERQRIISVSLSPSVKSININKNTPKHLQINADKFQFGQRKFVDLPSMHNCE